MKNLGHVSLLLPSIFLIGVIIGIIITIIFI